MKRREEATVRPRGGRGKRSTSIRVFFVMVVVFQITRLLPLASVSVFPAASDETEGLASSLMNNAAAAAAAAAEDTTSTTSVSTSSSCRFRDYGNDPDRFYGLATSEQYPPPPFLRKAYYIYGRFPILLPVETSAKVCPSLLLERQGGASANTTTTSTTTTNRMDGTNPSLLSFERLQRELSPDYYFPWNEQLLQDGSSSSADATPIYLVAASFKSNHQCDYVTTGGEDTNVTTTDINPPRQLLPGRDEWLEVDLFIVDSNIRTLWQSHVCTSTLNDQQGKNPTTTARTRHYFADDARIFLHHGEIWMSYKQYGRDSSKHVDTLRINRIQFEQDPYHNQQDENPLRQLRAFMDPSEEIELCCGRNFAALPSSTATTTPRNESRNNTTLLSFVTWTDPVWVQSVDTSHQTTSATTTQRRLQRRNNDKTTKRRVEFFKNPPTHNVLSSLLIPNTTTGMEFSHFHGTSNQLLYLPETNEYLGVAHVHRDRLPGDDKKEADYGHHYTHAFFTISGDKTLSSSYQLTRLSREFILPSNVPAFKDDGTIIQFASGLEWVPSSQNTKKNIAIGHGINDCEGGIVTVAWDLVNALLKSVKEGTHLTSTMAQPDLDDEEVVLQWNQPTASGPYMKAHPFRMLIGIFTTESDHMERTKIKETFAKFNTYMDKYNVTTLPRVCSLHEYWHEKTVHPREECQLLYTFVVGAAKFGSDDPEASYEYVNIKDGRPIALDASQVENYVPEVTYLNIVENMNDGKSNTWFQYAATQLPEDLGIDLVAKADTGTLIYPTELVYEIDRVRREMNLSYPLRRVHGGSRQIGRGLTYMQGGFYFLSRDMAQYIGSEECDQDRIIQQYKPEYDNTRAEDVEMSRLVRSYPGHVNEMEIPRYSAFYHHSSLEEGENLIKFWKWYLATLVVNDRIAKEQVKTSATCPVIQILNEENDLEVDGFELRIGKHYDFARQRFLHECQKQDALRDYQICRPTSEMLYKCEGERYEAFADGLEALVLEVKLKKPALWGKRRLSPFPANATILAVGNADTRQLLRTLSCQYSTLLSLEVELESQKSYNPLRRGSYVVVEFSNRAKLHLVTNNAIFFAQDWERYLVELVEKKSLQEFDALIVGKLNKMFTPDVISTFAELVQEKDATRGSEQQYNSTVMFPPTLVDFAKRYHGPIVATSPFGNVGNNSLFVEMKWMLKSALGSNRTNNIRLVNGRDYVSRIGDCTTFDIYKRVGVCEDAPTKRPCVGQRGGLPDLVAWDVVEALQDLLGGEE